MHAQHTFVFQQNSGLILTASLFLRGSEGDVEIGMLMMRSEILMPVGYTTLTRWLRVKQRWLISPFWMSKPMARSTMEVGANGWVDHSSSWI